MRPSIPTIIAAASTLVTLSAAQGSSSADFPSELLRSEKRGFCQANDEDLDFWDEDNGMTWYYNYESTPTRALNHDRMQFVPMLWGSHQASNQGQFERDVSSLIDEGFNITHVLGFNEPDHCDGTGLGSCIDAQTAAELWITEIEPLRTSLNVSLGAPAVTGAETGHTWLENFFSHCDGRCNPDFIPIHWYGNFESFASHIGRVNGSYPNMTMWITEFAYADASLEESQAMYRDSIRHIEQDGLWYVERYSWFGAFRSTVSNVGPNAAFLNEDGELTDIGAWYLDQPGQALGRVPESAGARAGAPYVAVLAVGAAVLAVVGGW